MLQETRREATMRVIGDKIKTFDRVEKAFYTSIILSGIILATILLNSKRNFTILYIQSFPLLWSSVSRLHF